MSSAAFRTMLLSAATSGSSAPQNCAGYVNMTIYLAGSGTINAGTLILEEADYDVTGTHGPIQIPPTTWSAITGSNPIDCTEVSAGLQKAYQLPPGAYSFVRARIGTSIGGGGTLTVTLVGL